MSHHIIFRGSCISSVSCLNPSRGKTRNHKKRCGSLHEQGTRTRPFLLNPRAAVGQFSLSSSSDLLLPDAFIRIARYTLIGTAHAPTPSRYLRAFLSFKISSEALCVQTPNAAGQTRSPNHHFLPAAVSYRISSSAQRRTLDDKTPPTQPPVYHPNVARRLLAHSCLSIFIVGGDRAGADQNVSSRRGLA